MAIYVFKNLIFIGILKEEKDRFFFTYDEQINHEYYLESLPNKINQSKNLFPIFENLIPENEVIDGLILRHNIKNTIDILLHLDNLSGSFLFLNKEDYQKIYLKKQNIYKYKDVRESILVSNYIYPNILDGYIIKDIDENKLHPKELRELTDSTAIGLAGAQYKFAVSLDHEKKEIFISDKKNDEYFLKPYSKERCIYKKRSDNKNYIPYLLINEHIFMTMARDYGFKVPYNAIIKDDIDYHYVIKRYDNYNGIKFDHIDFLTLIGKASKYKYTVSIDELIDNVFIKLETDELLILYKFFVFSVIIGHGDLHAKNLSLISKQNLLSEKDYILSPFYDIATTRIYSNKAIESRDIGLKLATTKKSRMKKDDLLYLSKKMNIEITEATKIIEEFSIKFIREFKNKYIDKLPYDIKSLVFYVGDYGPPLTLEMKLMQFYDKRVKEINGEFVDIISLPT